MVYVPRTKSRQKSRKSDHKNRPGCGGPIKSHPDARKKRTQKKIRKKYARDYNIIINIRERRPKAAPPLYLYTRCSLARIFCVFSLRLFSQMRKSLAIQYFQNIRRKTSLNILLRN